MWPSMARAVVQGFTFEFEALGVAGHMGHYFFLKESV